MAIATRPDDPPESVSSRREPGVYLAASGFSTRVGSWTRVHALFTTCLGLAALLRLLVTLAYPPALEFYGDSPAYLIASRHPFRLDIWHPFAYPLLLWLLSALRSLAAVSVLQHLLGLASAVLVYRLVRSVGVGSIGGTVAAFPLLFDAYQLDVEQFVLSDTLFTFLVIVAVTLAARLLRQQTLGTAVGLGGVLAVATLTRVVGLTLIPAVGAILLVARVGWRTFGALTVAAATPIAAYALAFHASYGVFALQGYGGRSLYALVAPFANCDVRALAADQRALCPTLPTYARPGINQYMWEIYNDAHLPGTAIQRSHIAGDFARPIIMRQPLDVAATVAGNAVHYFASARTSRARDWFICSWQFPVADRPRVCHISPAHDGFRVGDHAHGRIVAPLAALLRRYQRVFWTPGPLLLLALASAFAACCLREAGSVRRTICGLLAATGIGLVLLPSVSAGFDWRYLLPAQAVIAPAGVVALSALIPRLSNVWRRALACVATLITVALVTLGIATSPLQHASALHPALTASVPAALQLGERTVVEVGTPRLLGADCGRRRNGHARLIGFMALPVTVTYHSGDPHLIQPADFLFSNGTAAARSLASAGPVLPDVVLSGRYRRAAGDLYVHVKSPAGIVRYVDAAGTGALAWKFDVPTPHGAPPLGSSCTPGPAERAAASAPHLRLRRPVTAIANPRHPLSLPDPPNLVDADPRL